MVTQTVENQKANFSKDKTLLIFDGECVLCNNWVKFVLKHDSSSNIYVTTRSEALYSEGYKKFIQGSEQTESVIALINGEIFTHSDAAFKILGQLDTPYSYFSIGRYIPKFLRDLVYNAIARWRYRIFGKQAVCDIAFQQQYASRFIKFQNV